MLKWEVVFCVGSLPLSVPGPLLSMHTARCPSVPTHLLTPSPHTAWKTRLQSGHGRVTGALAHYHRDSITCTCAVFMLCKCQWTYHRTFCRYSRYKLSDSCLCWFCHGNKVCNHGKLSITWELPDAESCQWLWAWRFDQVGLSNELVVFCFFIRHCTLDICYSLGHFHKVHNHKIFCCIIFERKICAASTAS